MVVAGGAGVRGWRDLFVLNCVSTPRVLTKNASSAFCVFGLSPVGKLSVFVVCPRWQAQRFCAFGLSPVGKLSVFVVCPPSVTNNRRVHVHACMQAALMQQLEGVEEYDLLS